MGALLIAYSALGSLPGHAADSPLADWRRTLALVRGRYVVIADRFVADGEHDRSFPAHPQPAGAQ